MMGALGKSLFGWLASDKPGKAYRIIVKDEAGAPVKGVRVQLCSPHMCSVGETDGKGVAVFKDLEEMIHTVHVLKVPDGFAEDHAEYETPKTFGDTTITLKTVGTVDKQG